MQLAVPARWTIIVALLVSAAALAPLAYPAGSATPPSSVPAAASGWLFDYLLIILMENHAICNILTTCGGTGPYMTGLANAHASATQYVDCSRPSLPNYLCLSGASDFGCGGYDGAPRSNPCTNLTWNSQNIVDRLEASRLTWKAYMEDMPSNCYGSNNGTYVVRHNPFVYYSDIGDNATRCGRVVPAGAADVALLADLGSTSSASNYMWLTPNVCNDMHSCSVSTGDNYLKGLVPQILSSTIFTTKKAALFITFDEDSDGRGAPNLYAVWAGPAAKTGFTSSVTYNHFSLLATIESNWNLSALTSADASAPSMTEFFGSNPPSNPTPPMTFSLPLFAGIVVAIFVAVGAIIVIISRRRKKREEPLQGRTR